MAKSLFKTPAKFLKTLVICFSLAFSLSAEARAKSRKIASDEPIDSVTCRLRHDPTLYIKAEYLKPTLSLKVAIRLSGPAQNGYHGRYSLLTAADARGQKDLIDAARKEDVSLAKVDRVAVFSLNGGFTIYKFLSKGRNTASVLSVLGSTYSCAPEAATASH